MFKSSKSVCGYFISLLFTLAVESHILTGQSYMEIMPGDCNSDNMSEDIQNERISVLHSQQHTLRSTTLIAKYVILAVLLNVVGLTIIYFVLLKRVSGPHGVETEFFPAPEYETRIFHAENLKPGPEQEAQWEADLPKGAGFVIIDSPERYNLPPGVKYKDGYKRYGVSWAHQYHCVWMLKTAFWKLVQNNSSLPGVSMEIVPGRIQTPEEEEIWHLAHCFGYLREIINCNMDMTLEYPTLKGANTGTVNGYEIPHQCKRREPYDHFISMHAPDQDAVVEQDKIAHQHHNKG